MFVTRGNGFMMPLILRVAVGWAALSASPVTAGELQWVDDDWSNGGYESVSGLSPEVSPGELVLVSHPEDLIEFATTASPMSGGTGIGPYTDLAAMLADPGNPAALLLLVGNSPHQFHGAEVVRYSLDTDALTLDLELFEDGGNRMITAYGRIIVPGADTTLDPDEGGNVYIYDPTTTTWDTHIATVPEVTHLFDIEEFAGSLMVGGRFIKEGAIFRSDDEGITWSECYRDIPAQVMGLGRLGSHLFGMIDYTRIRRFASTECIEYTDSFLPGAAFAMIPLPIFTSHDDRLFLSTFKQLFSLDDENGSWVERPLPVQEGQSELGLRHPVPIIAIGDSLYAAGWDGTGTSDDALSLWKTGDETSWTVVDSVIADADPYSQGVGPNIRSLLEWHGRLFLGEGRQKRSKLPARLYAARCVASGTLDSRPHDFGAPIDSLTLTGDALLPPGTSVGIQIRTGLDEAALADAAYRGPDGTDQSVYGIEGSVVYPSAASDRWLQYRLFADGADDGRLSPIVTSVVFESSGEAVVVGADGSSLASTALSVFPHPTRGRSEIRFHTPPEARVDVSVFTVGGQLVRTLVSSTTQHGAGSVVWDGKTSDGRPAAAGVYVIRLRIDDRVVSRQLTKLR